MNNILSAKEIFDKYAKVYQSKYMDLSLYHDSFDAFCSHITRKNAEVLDIACGPGNVTQYLLKVRPELQIFGIDIAPNMIGLARKNNPSARFEVMDCNEIDLLHQKFDAIMCAFCLPYLSKAQTIKLIQHAALLLEAGGILYLSTMEDEYDNSGLRSSSSGEQTTMYFYQAEDLVSALVATGFEILELRRQDFPTGDDSKTTDLLIIARK